jgi:hypothetical protein
VSSERGRVLFDADRDEVPARHVPAEAHRRFRADLRGRKERNRQTREAQLAVHKEKRCFVADWIATHGTPDQKARQAEGLLPIAEAIETITDHAFGAITARNRYVRNGNDRLQAFLRQSPAYANAVVRPADVDITTSTASEATAAQWRLVEELRRVLPESTVALRRHTVRFKRDPVAPALQLFSVVVTLRYQVLTLRREYAAPEP